MSKAGRWVLAGVLAGAAGTGWLLRREAARLATWSANRRVRVLVLGEAPSARLYALLLARSGVRVELVPDLGRTGGAPGLSQRLHARLLPSLARAQGDVALQTLDVALVNEYDLVLAASDDPAQLARLIPLATQGPLVLLRESPMGLPELASALGEVSCLLALPGYVAQDAADKVAGEIVAVPEYAGVATLGESDGALTQRLQQAVSVLRRAHVAARATAHITDALVGHAARLLALRRAVEGVAAASDSAATPPDVVDQAERAYRERLMALAVGRPEAYGPGRSARSTTALTGVRLLATLPCARRAVSDHLAAARPWLDAWATALAATAVAATAVAATATPLSSSRKE